MNSEKNLSIALFISIFFSLAIPVSVVWFFTLSNQKANIVTHLNEEKNETLSLLTASLETPLWNFKKDQIRSLCDPYIQMPHIRKIVVTDSIMNSVLYDQTDTQSTGSMSSFGERIIRSHGKNIGSLYVELSSVTYEQKATSEKVKLLILFLLELIVSFLLITYMIYYFILGPLHAKMSAGMVLICCESQGKKKNSGILLERINRKIIHIISEVQRYHNLVDDNVIIFKIDGDCVIQFVTKEVTTRIGFTKQELTGYSFDVLFPDAIKKQQLQSLRQHIDAKLSPFEIKCIRSGGNEIWLRCKVSHDNKDSITLICEDITDNKKVEKHANTDALTGLLNRRSIDVILKREQSLYERYKTEFSILLIDLDHFKKINDMLGHQQGDEVLVQFSKLLKENVRRTDHVARWGGEEFLIVCSNTSIENAIAIAEYICKKVATHSFGSGSNVTCSIGVSSINQTDSIYEKIIKSADDALYIAKEKGRNQVFSIED
jgi:diguanylate cyclase (GGDEF)-like protein/PAS domain S-box-containing protein